MQPPPPPESPFQDPSSHGGPASPFSGGPASPFQDPGNRGAPPSPFGPPRIDTPQPPPKRPVNKAAWIAVPALVIGLGAGVYGCMVGFDEPVKPGDRELVVTFEDLTEGMGITKDPSRETFKRTWYIDGTVDIVYEYDGGESTPPVFLSSQVSQTRGRSDAEGQFIGMKVGASAIFTTMGEGITESERNDLFTWGDKSTLVLLQAPAGKVGNYFVARSGSKVVMVMFTGIFMDDKDAVNGLLSDKLQKISAASF